MDEVTKRSKSTPGPGAYNKEKPKKQAHTKGSFR